MTAWIIWLLIYWPLGTWLLGWAIWQLVESLVDADVGNVMSRARPRRSRLGDIDLDG